MKKIAFLLFKLINKILYRKIDISSFGFSEFYLFKIAFFQKVLGFNRHVPWPVHFTTQVKAPEKINPGSRAPGLSMSCYLDGRNGIVFGENVWVGPRVTIISQNHDSQNLSLYLEDSPVIIGKDSWLGANSVILPGVELGEKTIVGAAAVVTKSFKDGNQVIAGNPAKIVKRLN